MRFTIVSMRVVFLDIEGVLSKTDFKAPFEPCLDKFCCHLMSELCAAARAKVVICSNTWKAKFDRKMINEALGKVGFFLFDSFPFTDWKTDSEGPTPGHEIRRWLCDRVDIDSYVIVSAADPRLFQYSAKRLICTKPTQGFQWEHYNDAYRLLVS